MEYLRKWNIYLVALGLFLPTVTFAAYLIKWGFLPAFSKKEGQMTTQNMYMGLSGLHSCLKYFEILDYIHQI